MDAALGAAITKAAPAAEPAEEDQGFFGQLSRRFGLGGEAPAATPSPAADALPSISEDGPAAAPAAAPAADPLVA